MKYSKKILIIISLILIVATATGTSLAYIITRADAVSNSFVPVYVDCEVLETFDGSTVKSDVKIKNTGDIKAYVRATFVIMWMSETGTVYSAAPVKGVDYTIAFGSASWYLGSDGFYYYALPVEAGMSTEALIDNVTITSTADVPEGHNLVVHVAATAIQAEPGAAVENAWGGKVNANGTLVAP